MSSKEEDRYQSRARDTVNEFIELTNEMSINNVNTSEILGSMFTVAFTIMRTLMRSGVPLSEIQEVIKIAGQNSKALDGRTFKQKED